MSKNCLQRMTGFMMITVLLITSQNSNAQLNPPLGTSPWKFVNPSPNGYSWTDMSFIDNNTGLAVGASGGMAKTTDGGLNWVSIPFKFINASNTVSIANFNDVQFVTPGIAYAVGSGGLMIKTTDGGINWTTVTTPLTPLGRNINALHFNNKDTGYIGGAAINTTNTTNINDAPKVYFTKNGGVTWDSLVTPFKRQQNNATLSGFNQSEIQRIHFVNDSVGYVTGSCGNVSANYSAILWKVEKNVIIDYSLHRSKFGQTATTGSYTPCTQTYKGILGINDSLVIISSLNNNLVIRVRTGKNDSTANAVPAVWGSYEKGVYEIVVWLNSTATPFPASLNGNVAGQMPQIKRTPDGKVVIASGNSLIFSTDNGTTWSFTKPHPNTVNYSHWGFSALDVTQNGRIVIGSFNGLIYDSLPGSASPWRTSYKNLRPLFYSFSDMDWADCNNGIVVGANGSILKTSDGGKTWVNNSNNVFDAAQISLINVSYPAVDNMFFSAGTTIYRSPDQGTTLNSIFTEPNPNSGGISAFTMVGTSRAFAVGYRFSPTVQRTVIFRSQNPNAVFPVWDTVKTFPQGNFAPQLRNIKFANADTGYVCGNRGKVYRTFDGGNSWIDVSPDTTAAGNGTATYTGLAVVDGKTVYVGGSSRKLFKTIDGGVTWTDLTLNATTNPIVISSFASVQNIIMNDANNGYIQAGGVLLKTNNGWATWTYDLSPFGMQNISLYPKIPGPLDNKKLYVLPLTFGFPGPISTQTAYLLEYGNVAAYTMSTSETSTGASCTNPTAGTITVTATGGIAPYSYSINGSPYQSSNVFTGLTQGAKTVTIKDAACGIVTKTVNVGFTDNLTLATNNDTTVCAGAPVQMFATSQATSFSWSPNAGLSNAGISNPIATVNGNTSFTVTATLNGCVKTKTVNVAIKPNPVVNAGNDKTIVEGDETQLWGTANNLVSVAWTPANSLRDPNTLTPVAKPSATTTYIMTVKNTDNCTSTDDVKITVIPYCIKIMNAFTPNRDGMNDQWIVTNGSGCTERIKAVVYNRYGQEVYKNDNYNNTWDGTYSGKPVPDGTYYYVITYYFIGGRVATMKGDVTILR